MQARTTGPRKGGKKNAPLYKNKESNGLSHPDAGTLLGPLEATVLILVTLTHNMAMIQPSFTSKKWNMGEILPFFGLKMMVKSGLEKMFLKFLHAEAIFLQFILLHRNEAFSTKSQIQ